MIVLQNITDSLEIVLSGAVATNQLPFVVTYVDSTTTTYSPLRTTGLTNNTTAVTMVASPAASTSRTIKTISIQNKDTAIRTVLVSYNDNGTRYVVLKVTLDIGDNLEYTETNGWKVITTDGAVKLGSTSGGGTWGSITGTLSAQTDLQTELDNKVDENAPITGATKTKITYDAKGLVTSGADATTADIAPSTDRNYVTDAQQTVISNTSGVNTGDNAVNSLYSGLITNATHTGEVTGATALTVDKTAITNKTTVTIDGADYVLISDTSDSGNLKKGLVSDLGGFDDGDFTLIASFKSLYNY